MRVMKYLKKAMLLSSTKEAALKRSMAQIRAASVISLSLLPVDRAFCRDDTNPRCALWEGLDLSTLSVMSFKTFCD